MAVSTSNGMPLTHANKTYLLCFQQRHVDAKRLQPVLQIHGRGDGVSGGSRNHSKRFGDRCAAVCGVCDCLHPRLHGVEHRDLWVAEHHSGAAEQRPLKRVHSHVQRVFDVERVKQCFHSSDRDAEGGDVYAHSFQCHGLGATWHKRRHKIRTVHEAVRVGVQVSKQPCHVHFRGVQRVGNAALHVQH